MIDYEFRGGTALVTGAAGGIGHALAEGLAAAGSHLVLLDRDEAGLATLVDDLEGRFPVLRVDTVVVDLADRAATATTAARLAEDHPELTLVINNAGVALAGRFDEVSAEEFDWLLAINLHAVITISRALLPVLRSHPGSHLANVSSVYGLIGPAGQSAYATAKFGVRGFTDVLRHELAGRVGVTCVHPGGIATRIATDARIGSGVDPARAAELAGFDRLLTIPPSVAAATILRGIGRRRPRVLIGATATIPDLLARLAPGSYDRWLRRLLR